MFFTISLFIASVVCFFVSLISFCFLKTKISTLRVNFLLFTLAFFILGNIIIIPVLQEKYGSKEEATCTEEMSESGTETWNNVPIEPEVPAHDHKGVAPLSLYVTDGADISETYYVEATDHDTYKFCYFHDDGSHIVKKEVPLSKVQCEFSNTNLPYRVEVLLKDNEPVFYTLYLPEDSNSIQFDHDNK